MASKQNRKLTLWLNLLITHANFICLICNHCYSHFFCVCGISTWVLHLKFVDTFSKRLFLFLQFMFSILDLFLPYSDSKALAGNLWHATKIPVKEFEACNWLPGWFIYRGPFWVITSLTVVKKLGFRVKVRRWFCKERDVWLQPYNTPLYAES